MKSPAELRAILDQFKYPSNDTDFVDLDALLLAFDYVPTPDATLPDMVVYKHPRGWRRWPVNRSWTTFSGGYVARIRDYLTEQATREGRL